MNWLLGVIIVVVLYIISFLFTPYYGNWTGGLPLPVPWMAGVLTCIFAGIGICLGTAWERHTDDEGYEEPFGMAMFLVGVLAIPILLHRLPDFLPLAWVSWPVLMAERYRFWIALAVLVVTCVAHEINVRLFIRHRRKIEEQYRTHTA